MKPHDVLIPVDWQGADDGQNPWAAVTAMALNALSDIPQDHRMNAHAIAAHFPRQLSRSAIPTIIDAIQPNAPKRVRFRNHIVAFPPVLPEPFLSRAIRSQLDQKKLVQLTAKADAWRTDVLGEPMRLDFAGNLHAILVHGYVHEGTGAPSLLRIQDPLSGPRIEPLDRIFHTLSVTPDKLGLIAGVIIGEFSRKS